ncbi:cytochrome c oxidase assembly factor CtaG [Sediminibacillus massiliensis]|uniref:cytochrome c oxidase assembly factor CtaG n=1 Tax=Sediminibacillus massiliensis TaxID=1926277 RepID=UPI000988327C|nr:cytochrome c oxidase assembly factor CtaG [Sediminibacillus massiliensis]
MWLELQIFGFRALWSPYYLLFVVGLGVLYYLITVVWKDKLGNGERPSASQFAFFYSGLALLYIVKGSPVDLISHIMFTSHMVQMAVYYLVFPIFIIKGIPEWIWRKVLSIPVIKQMFAVLTKPLVALLLFNGLFSMYHYPVIFDFAKANTLSHAVITTVILVTAFLVWWPIFTPIKEMDTLSPLLKIGFIFANGVLITPACGLIIFAGHSLYSTYSDPSGWVQAMSLCVPANVLDGLTLTGPQMFSPIPVIDDQQLGGILMKVTQEIVYGIVLARIFFAWFKQDADKIDPLPASSTTSSEV